MRSILKGMIFFRKKKPEAEPALAEPVKKSAPAPKKAEPEPSAPVKIVKSLQEIAHARVQTAEGWRRSAEKKLPKKR